MGFSWWCKSFGALFRLRCFRKVWTSLRKIWRAWLLALWMWLRFPSWHHWALMDPMLNIFGETCKNGCPSQSSHRCITCFCPCTTRSLAGFRSQCQWFCPISCSLLSFIIIQLCLTSWSMAAGITAGGSGSLWATLSTSGHTPKCSL